MIARNPATAQPSRTRPTLRSRLVLECSSALLVLLAACGLPGCDDECPTRGCTASWEAGLWVTVVHAETGLAAACGATAWVTDGSYIDTLRASGCSMPESLQTGAMLGAHERPGTYEIFVEKEGYHPWHRSEVAVVRKKCDCHVRTVKLEARLQPL